MRVDEQDTPSTETGGITATPMPSRGAELVQQGHRSGAVAAEAEVVADDDVARAKLARQHVVHERLGARWRQTRA